MFPHGGRLRLREGKELMQGHTELEGDKSGLGDLSQALRESGGAGPSDRRRPVCRAVWCLGGGGVVRP